MKTVMVFMLVCGQLDIVLVTPEDAEPVAYEIEHVDHNTGMYLQELSEQNGTVNVVYQDPRQVCI